MLNKSITSGKEKRKPYRKSKQWDASCRNHGSCNWCYSNRHIQRMKAEASAEDRWKEFKDLRSVTET